MLVEEAALAGRGTKKRLLGIVVAVVLGRIWIWMWM
jgi:hypothetical protein